MCRTVKKLTDYEVASRVDHYGKPSTEDNKAKRWDPSRAEKNKVQKVLQDIYWAVCQELCKTAESG